MAIAQAEMPVIARIHDAFITSGKLSDATQGVINDKLREAHSLIRIECERVSGWQSLENRLKNEAIDRFEAAHKAFIAQEEAAARVAQHS